MTVAAEPPNQANGSPDSTWSETEKAAAVLKELERVLASKHFKNSVRKRQVLEYVVHRMLEGNCDRLKERTIGAEIFNRSPDYATGDDPIVRVQAGEVRRRLEQFYQEEPNPSPLKIELPLGSYAPRFHWTSPESPATYVAPDRMPPQPPASRAWRLATILAVLALAAIGIGITYSR